MSGARDAILGALRANRRPPRPAAGPHPVPARGHLDAARQAILFAFEARRVDATVARLDGIATLPLAIADYLATQGLPPRFKAAPDPWLDAVAWPEQTPLAVERGVADPADAVGLAVAFAAVAETGTLVMASGPQSPTALNFLPDTHIVVVPLSRLVGTYEEAWARLRSRGDGFMPRAVNWITGPSRTADIERQLLLGVHGPRRLHILMVDEQD